MMEVRRRLHWAVARAKGFAKPVPQLVKKYRKKVAGIMISILFAFLLVGKLVDVSVGRTKEDKAKEVVKLLYDFGNEEQLEEQEHLLRKYVTDAVYNQLVVDNDNRELRAYMAFYNNPSTVEFVKVTENYVIFRLDSLSIDNGRTFILIYKTDVSGKICEVFESELVDFMESE